MGSGGSSAKLQFLIEREAERQFPREKHLLLARWIETRCESIRLGALTNKMRSKLIEMGYTEEKLKEIEYGDDPDDS